MGLIRILLAITVVIAHSTPFMGLSLTGGQFAVQGFFIISGFYISLILHNKYEASWAGTKLFYGNRFLRIYPVYWTALLLSLIISLLELRWPHYIHTLGTVSALSDLDATAKALFLAINLAIVGMDWSLFDSIRNSRFFFIPQAWSLSIEVVMYALAPFLFRRSIWLLASLLAGAVLIRLVAAGAGFDKDPWTYR